MSERMVPVTDCPAISELEGYPIPCAQLMDDGEYKGVLVDGEAVPHEEKMALCATTLRVASEVPLSSPAACGFQKFATGTKEEQVRIRSIMEGGRNAT